MSDSTQMQHPRYDTLRSIDGETHQALKMDTQPDTLSEQTRLELIKVVAREEIKRRCGEGEVSA
ncbi:MULTISPECIES: hypothetical protein [unclassified Saccharibacter]|uniref:hypothetical protein n=1 Tax=unclassified Saccharibacter TaxID=2648722 RepID=UPI00132CC114|nr:MULTISPECIES: hypothetical protein [unclassified Saccharibacter]MXV35942.1 hypothetical protein [Saccharibacter sp. EH611]MXV58376.1 hypothetical protein [Saccharibacter sp. EH70]MXV65832.1 hypothetical protein [Saccharibacter sp. EH60]